MTTWRTEKGNISPLPPQPKKEAEYKATQYIIQKEEQKKALPEYTLYDAIGNYCDLKNNVLSPTTIREYRRSQKNNYADIKDIKLSALTMTISSVG